MELILINNNNESELIEVDVTTKFEHAGLELPGWTRLSALCKEKNPSKVQIAHDTPKAKIIEIRANIPQLIPIELTKELEYEGRTNETNIPARLRQLAPSAPKEIIEKLHEQFKAIRLIMDDMNKDFKTYQPKNATRQGSINHHFPSPQFPETSKN